jgi:hypothetical protein
MKETFKLLVVVVVAVIIANYLSTRVLKIS